MKEEKGVISMDDWVMIRNYKKRNQDQGVRKIAKHLGISKNTVKRALMSDIYPSYKKREGTAGEPIKAVDNVWSKENKIG